MQSTAEMSAPISEPSTFVYSTETDTSETQENTSENRNQREINNQEHYAALTRNNLINLIANNISKLKYGDIEEPINLTCAITQEEFSPDEDVAKINYCNHIFNYEQLISWLLDHQTCPICRYNILTNSNLIKYSDPANDQTYILNSNQFRNLFADSIINQLFIARENINNRNRTTGRRGRNDSDISGNTSNIIAFAIES